MSVTACGSDPSIAVEDRDLKQSGVVDVPPPPGWIYVRDFDRLPKPRSGSALPTPAEMISIVFELEQGGGFGQAYIARFASPDPSLDLYNRVAQADVENKQTIAGLGERAVLVDTPTGTLRQINFVRCQVQVMLMFSAWGVSTSLSDEDFIAYGQRLDAALQPHVCS
ncbi:MAG TPA: hypothetical protein VGD69_16310 [Herpetosiphonaceae bacterium]